VDQVCLCRLQLKIASGNYIIHLSYLTLEGIGLTFVKNILDRGAKVIIADLRLHSDASKVGITSATPNVYFQTCDVAKWDQLENLIKISENEFGDVPDIYVAAAGVFEPVISPNLCFYSSLQESVVLVKFLERSRNREIQHYGNQRQPPH